MESASLALLVLLASPAVLFTKDVNAATDPSSSLADSLQQLELLQHQHQEDIRRWEEEKRVLKDNFKSIHSELRSERLQWLVQQQVLANDVKSLAAELKSEKQEWLGQKQIMASNAKSLQAEVQFLSLKVHTLENTLSGMTSPGTTSEKHALEDPAENMDTSHKQTQPPIEKRSDNRQTSKDKHIGSTTLKQLESKMDQELRALNTTVTLDVQQLRTQMTTYQTAVTSAYHVLGLMQNQLTAVNRTALIALREASHVQSEMSKSGGSSRTSEAKLRDVYEKIDSEVRGMNQRLDGATQTLQNELVLIVKVLNAKTDTEVTQLAATQHSEAGALNHSVAMATQGVQAVGSQIRAVNSRVQAIEQAITRQDIDILQAGGSAYIRWGKATCHTRNQVIYIGKMAGGDKSSGSMLCLPAEVDSTEPLAPSEKHTDILGTVYQIPGTRNGRKQLKCTVCHTYRSTTITMPATTQCPDGWTQEYSGFLMSGAQGSSPHDLVCVDSEPVGRPDTAGPSLSVPLNYATIACGTLPCRRYPDGTVVTCAVCSM